jgi:hypothetical protein
MKRNILIIGVFLSLLLVITGCENPMPATLTLSDDELHAFTKFNVTFNSRLLNCRVAADTIKYSWENDTSKHQLNWDSKNLNAYYTKIDSNYWIDVDHVGSGYFGEDKRYVNAFMSTDGSKIDSVILTRNYTYEYRALHIVNDKEINEFVKVRNLTLVEKSQDSVVYNIDLGQNHEMLDSVSYHYHEFFNSNISDRKSCGISWQNNTGSLIRVTLYK